MRCGKCGRFARAAASAAGGLVIAACTLCGTVPLSSQAGAQVAIYGPSAVIKANEWAVPHSGENETALQSDDLPHTHQEFDSEPLPEPDSSVVRTFVLSGNAVPGLARPGALVPGAPARWQLE